MVLYFPETRRQCYGYPIAFFEKQKKKTLMPLCKIIDALFSENKMKAALTTFSDPSYPRIVQLHL